LLRDLARLVLVAALSASAGAGHEPALALASMLLLRQLVLIVGLSMGSARLLSWLPVCDLLVRLSFFGTCIVLAVVAAMAPHDPTPGQYGAAAVSMPPAGDSASVEVEVENGRARIVIHGPVELNLSVETEEDERLVMVLCRLLTREDGKPALTFREIAKAFGKNSRQACQNHMQKLAQAAGSLARMILHGRRGRPSKIHPTVLAAIARHWERNPLATPEQTHRWLAAQQFGDDVPLPSVDQLQEATHVQGNLVRMRNKIRRLLDRNADRATVRPDVVFERLLEVVDAQAGQLQEAGLEPVPIPGIVQAALGDIRRPKARLSKTVRVLLSSLQALTKQLSPQRDAELCGSIGDWQLSPLHLGALYCLLQLSEELLRRRAQAGQAVALCPLRRRRHHG
jgi:hypothetical protein